MTAADRPAWLEWRRRRHGASESWEADRRQHADQVAGYAARFADALPRWVSVVGDPIDALDVLDALYDTGLALAVDLEGITGDALAAVLFKVEPDPLDIEPAVDTHWDREAEGRDEADQRRHIRRFDQEEP